MLDKGICSRGGFPRSENFSRGIKDVYSGVLTGDLPARTPFAAGTIPYWIMRWDFPMLDNVRFAGTFDFCPIFATKTRWLYVNPKD
jgi:hypothetical protein